MTAERAAGRSARRRSARRILAWLAGLLLALILAVSAALVSVFTFEQATLRPLAEYLVKHFTGRAFAIAGGLEADAGRTVSIRAAGISLANAPWGSQDDLLNIDELRVSVDLLRLLDGMPAIDRLEASGVKLRFEEDGQGRSNWAMAAGDERPAVAAGSPAPADSSPKAIPLPVIYSRLTDVDISVSIAGQARRHELHFESIGHDAAQGKEFRAAAVGAIDERPVNLQARIGPLEQLLGAGAVNFDIDARLGALALKAGGELDKLLAPRQASLQISLETADIAPVFAMLGLPGTASGASALEIRMQPSGDQHAIDLAVSIGELKLDARGRLQALDTLDGASIAVSAGGPDLAAAARLAGLQGFPERPFELQSSASLSGRQLTLGETRFDSGDNHLTADGSMSRFPEFGGSKLKLRLVGKNYLEFAALLGIGDVATLTPEPFELRSSLDYDAKDLQQFSARLTLADVSGEFDGELTGNPAFAGSYLDYRLEGHNDGLVQRLLGRPTRVEGSFALQGKLRRLASGYDIEHAVLSFGANQLEIGGTLGEDPLHAGSELAAHFRGPDLDKIAAIAGYTGFMPAGIAEIDAAAQIRDDTIQVNKLAAQLGRNRLQASGQVRLQDGAAGSRVEVALSGEDIADLLPPDLLAYVDARQSFELDATLAAQSKRLAIEVLQARLGETSLKASGTVSTTQPLTDTTLQLEARGSNLAAIVPAGVSPYRLPAAKFSVDGGAALTASGLVLKDIDARIGDDRLGVSGTIPWKTPTEGLSLVVNAAGPNLRKVVPVELGQFEIAERPYEIAGEIRLAQGILSLRQLDFAAPRGRLTGHLSVAIDDPRRFGEFDLEANGKDLREFSASTRDYRPAQVAFDVDARGNWDSERIKIEQGNIRFGSASVEARGEVDLPPGVTSTRLEFSARGDNLSDLGQFRDLVLPTQDFDIDIALRGDTEGLEIPRLNARVGKSDLRGSLRMAYADKPRLVIELQSEKLNLAQVLPARDSTEENEAASKPPQSDGRLIPQLAVPADQLNRVDLETRIRMAELDLPRSILRDIEIDTSLRNGELTVTRLQARATEGQLIASFRANADGDRVVTSGTLQGTDIVFGKGQAGTDGPSLPKQNLELEFATEGATLRELAANLDGYFQLTGGAGSMENSRALDLFGSFFTELLSAINPFVNRERYTKISCFAAYAEITDGVAEIKPGAVMQTDKLNMFARGQVDLGSEEIQLRFDTTPRSGIGISLADFVNPFVGVSGTLADPGLGLDPKNAMFEGGFAYATGGLSIVATNLFDRWFGASDPCAKFAEEAQEYRSEKQLSKDKPTAEPSKPQAGSE